MTMGPVSYTHLRDAALSDDGVAVPADAGVQQQLVDVLEAAELAVDVYKRQA